MINCKKAMEKPHAPSCERNREPILAVLREHFADRHAVLEVGSGTGQHAVFFAAALPHLTWQASDRDENLAGIQAWLDEAALPNTPAPIEFNVNRAWPTQRYDAVFSANILRTIAAWSGAGRDRCRAPCSPFSSTAPASFLKPTGSAFSCANPTGSGWRLLVCCCGAVCNSIGSIAVTATSTISCLASARRSARSSSASGAPSSRPGCASRSATATRSTRRYGLPSTATTATPSCATATIPHSRWLFFSASAPNGAPYGGVRRLAGCAAGRFGDLLSR